MKTKRKKDKSTDLKKINKSFKLLGTSWSVQTKEFFENSTLHGVRYIAEEKRPFLERFMWFACVAVGAVATVIIIVSLWEKFQTNPTITGLDTDFHNWEVPFPAITVCQEIPTNLSSIQSFIETSLPESDSEEAIAFLQSLGKLSYGTLKNFKTYTKTEFVKTDADLKSLVFGLMNKCEDIFDTCKWKSKDYNCCELFYPVFTESGFCYSFNSRHFEKRYPGASEDFPEFNVQYIKETDIKWALSFAVKNTETNMPVYIINSDEQAGIDIQPQHLWDYRVRSISFSVKQTYTTSDTRQLSIKQRHCAFSNEIKLQIDHIYTYTACTRQCRMNTAMERCRCIPHFYPSILGKYKHCSIAELGCIADNLDKIISVDKCTCQLSCANTVYEVEKLNQNDGENIKSMEAEFLSWPMVRYKREVLFGWVDLLVSFGGIAGLFLGFSLLSGVEIIYYFTIRTCCMVVRESDKLKSIQKNANNEPKPKYDLSLTPYFVTEPLPGHGINEINKTMRKKIKKNNLNKNVSVMFVKLIIPSV